VTLGRADLHFPYAARPAAYAGGVRTCAFCGRTESDPGRLLLWTSAVEQGKHKDFCEVCSREHLRAMESKLDSEWW